MPPTLLSTGESVFFFFLLSFLFHFDFIDIVRIYNPGCLLTSNPPASVSHMLGLQVRIIPLGLLAFLCRRGFLAQLLYLSFLLPHS